MSTEHISPVLAALHWLPVRVRADFKVLLLTYKILNGLAPVYLSDLVNTYVPVRPLRSLVTSCLIVPKVNEKSAGERAFSFHAPTLWNSLPLDNVHAQLMSSKLSLRDPLIYHYLRVLGVVTFLLLLLNYVLLLCFICF